MAVEHPCYIDKLVMTVNTNVMHGGQSQRYQIIHKQNRYEISLINSRKFARPGEKTFKPSNQTYLTAKPLDQTSDFLEHLDRNFDLFSMQNLKSTTLLHPTQYKFEIKNSCHNDSHIFQYVIEKNTHINAKYEELINAFILFFDRSVVEATSNQGNHSP